MKQISKFRVFGSLPILRAAAAILACFLEFALAIPSWAQRLALVPELGHSQPVVSMSFSPDGKTLATGSGDRTAKLWDTASGKEICTLTGHANIVWSVCFSPEGRILATASADNTAKLWDSSNGKEIRTFTGHTAKLSTVCFSPDGKTLATASDDKTAKLWNAASGKEIRTLTGHLDGVTSACFSPDGKTLATGSADKTAKLWEAASGREIRTLTGHLDGVTSVCFSPDGKTLATGSADKTVKLWDVASGKEIRVLTGHLERVSSVRFSPDGKALATGSDDKTVKLWDTSSGNEIRTITGHLDVVYSVCFSPDGKTLATGSGDLTTKLWNVVSGKEILALSRHSDIVWSASFSPDGKTLATGSWDKTARLWDVTSGKEIRTLTGHKGFVMSVCFSPDGKTLATGHGSRTAKLWDVASGEEIRTLAGHAREVASVCFSPDGKTLATGSGDFTAKLWDVASGKEIRTLVGHKETVWSVSFSPDGKTLATGSETARLWDVGSGKEIRTLTGHGSTVTSVSFSPDGKTLATGSGDFTAKLWDVASGKEIRTLTGHTGVVWSVCFSPDGKTVVAGGEDNTTILWDVATGRQVRTLAGHSQTVSSVCFSQDGKTLATGSWDGTAKLWDTISGLEQCSLVSFNEGSWAVIDREGRFDGSSNGEVRWLHWVLSVPEKRILEPVDFDQFAGYYYTPSLLAKVWRRESLQKVPDLRNIAVFPEVRDLKLTGTRISATLLDRGGGIGDVHVFVNGLDVKTFPGRTHIDLDLHELKGLSHPQVSLYVYNNEGSVRSRAVESTAPALDKTQPPAHLVAIIGAVQHYAEPALNLGFSDADALSMTQAVLAMADGLHVPVDVELVCDLKEVYGLGPSVHVHAPDKAGFSAAFDAATRKADAGSALLLYLSGHGVAKLLADGRNNEFYFLTSSVNERGRSWLNNSTIVPQWTVSSKEITEMFSHALSCRRRIVILDTCEAGASTQDLLAMKSEQDDEARAKREMQAGQGTYELTGSAADRASLEAAEYGHGLLTYALLETLKNASLGPTGSPDAVVVATLLHRAAERTVSLASDIGRSQSPGVSAPDAGELVIGYMTPAARQSIQLHDRLPLMLKPSLVEIGTGSTDVADELAQALRQQSLAERGAGTSTAFAAYSAQDDSAPDAFRLQGTYSVDAQLTVTVDASIFRAKVKCDPKFPRVSGSRNEIVGKLLLAIRDWLATYSKVMAKPG